MGSKLLEWHGAIEAKFLNEINVYTSVGSFEWAMSHFVTFLLRSPPRGKIPNQIPLNRPQMAAGALFWSFRS